MINFLTTNQIYNNVPNIVDTYTKKEFHDVSMLHIIKMIHVDFRS